MVRIGTEQEYIERVLSLPRPGEENYLAFYEHRLGAIFKNPRLLLLPMDDHLVHRGDGIFEILQCVQGRIYQLDAHLARMRRSSSSNVLAPAVWAMRQFSSTWLAALIPDRTVVMSG